MKLILAVTLFISFAFPLISIAQSNTNTNATYDTLNFAEARVKAQDYIDKVLMQDGKATIRDFTELSGLYKIAVSANGNEGISFMSKDGKIFFTSGMDVQAEWNKYIDAHTPIKADKPHIELFVMSYCPYGTQMEKGFLPVLETLGNKVDFEIKFCAYAMHDKKELIEQMRQYVIMKEKPKLFLSYLKCFLEAGKSNECLTSIGMDTLKMTDQIAAVDTQYKVTEIYNDRSKWANGNYPYFNIYKDDITKYNVQGSPTLVINGKTVASARNPESLFELVCSAFNDPPKQCKTKLTSAVPSPGFGFTTLDSNSTESQNGKCTDK